MASIPAVATKLVVFDTAIIDMTDQLADPVEVLFGIQLGGGTDINQALAYCETLVTDPSRTHMVLISDLYRGRRRGRNAGACPPAGGAGVNLIVLLALNDDGRPVVRR